MAHPDFRPEQIHAALGEGFFDPVRPAAFPETRLRFRNDRWAARIGLDGLDGRRLDRHFARFEPLPGSFPEPLALRYHGHQFRVYNPDLGDGRGFLFAQARDLADGRLLDLGTKGSGTTPWSRGGDGRLTLKGGVREILATEMLEALGVYTSKTFSLIETGEALTRGDEPSPTRSSVLVRLSPQPHPHRQLPAPRRPRRDRRASAASSTIRSPTTGPTPPTPPTRSPPSTTASSAPSRRLGAEWFAAGFVHGVLNTDNIYDHRRELRLRPLALPRPLRARPSPPPTSTRPASTAFARQPEALNWNLARLGECLIPLSTRAAIEPVFDSFADRFQTDARPPDLRPPRPAPRRRPEPARALMHRFWGDDAGDRARRSSRSSTTSSAAASPSACARARSAPLFETAAWAEVIEALRALPRPRPRRGAGPPHAAATPPRPW